MSGTQTHTASRRENTNGWLIPVINQIQLFINRPQHSLEDVEQHSGVSRDYISSLLKNEIPLEDLDVLKFHSLLKIVFGREGASLLLKGSPLASKFESLEF